MAVTPKADHIGCRVAIKTSLGEVSEGICFTVAGGCVVLEQFLSSSSADSKANYTVFNTAAISEFKVVAEAPPSDGPPPAPLPAVDTDFVRSRMERAVTRSTEESLKINPKVTARTQAIFDALSKTMPAEWVSDPNQGVCIYLLQSVFIRAPYRPKDCVVSKGENRLMDRVQKVLAAIHKKLDADPRMR
uniref:AD domain-containing protein n=1 Tax=Haptolina brevifila TaxID=156173 RepID=A0A7S2IL25_9EUKA|mmetsp:Transcript_67792/g.134490  ORF Transcript_67792/g.134490 Transcript_67792/m.134490 type:complete len:189 (+) Transcript_67792:68-634(+)|eukprot:CAMPEP_0174716962 /NCGR_PEP_ID=MMETSP1094-20130205/25470_1 /TAXON_ID=156173 /ORGANISM="Chrysochromulina brevifilum, Strain UTEX LB 985" /LENGTH=188 /DNA_ID=CAMNT_0015916835 /DNA_START=58 /DNA_END=624 /DNA_ORIENTATION=+